MSKRRKQPFSKDVTQTAGQHMKIPFAVRDKQIKFMTKQHTPAWLKHSGASSLTRLQGALRSLPDTV